MNLVLWENGRLEIWYLSEDGEMFAALRMYDFDRPTPWEMRALGAENAGELAEFLADHIDFSAVCENNGAARSLVERARVSYDPDAAARLEAFYKSCAFRAARSFRASLRRIFTARASPAYTARAVTRTSAQSSRSLRSGTAFSMPVLKRRKRTRSSTITARSTRNGPSRRQWAAENGSYITSQRPPCTPA